MNPKERVITSIESSTPVVEPIGIFPGPQEIQPAFKKTRLMLEVERVIQPEDLREFLERNYFVKSLSQRDISQFIRNISEGHIQIRDGTISDWLKIFNVLARSRSEGAKLAWQNSDKRERKIEGIYSPASNRKISETRMKNWVKRSAIRKRSRAMRRYWENLSDEEREDRLRAVRETGGVAMLSHMREILGQDPTKRLREMSERLSPTQIAQEVGISAPTVRKWKRNLGIGTIKAGEVPGHIKTNKAEKQDLIKEARVRGLIEMLDGKEQYVIYARFPIEGDRRKRHVEIGRSLYPNRPKIYRQWPQEIETRALRKLSAMQKTA